MNIVLWLVAGALAALFLFAGLMKATQPATKLAVGMPWVEDFSPGVVKLIGAVEILGAIGLVLPAATGVGVVLTPLAATGIAVIMALAVVVHGRRREARNVVTNVVLLVLLVIVAALWFGPYAF